MVAESHVDKDCMVRAWGKVSSGNLRIQAES